MKILPISTSRPISHNFTAQIKPKPIKSTKPLVCSKIVDSFFVADKKGVKIPVILVENQKSSSPFISRFEDLAMIEDECCGVLNFEMFEGEDVLWVSSLASKLHPKTGKKLKGLGTQMLKHVVRESQKNGYNGAVGLSACNEVPPFVFYYKNNFLPLTNGPANYNLAAIHYAAKTDTPVERLVPAYLRSIEMQISPENAKLFLEGRRIIDDKICKKIRTGFIGGRFVDFNQLEIGKTKDEFVINAVDTMAKESGQLSSCCARFSQNSRGEKIIELRSFYTNTENERKLKIGTYKTAKKIAKSMGIKKVILSKEFLLN